MKKRLICLGLVLILLVGWNLINMPLHKYVNDLGQNDSYKLWSGTDLEKLDIYKYLYEKNEDKYVRRYILAEVGKLDNIHPKHKTFFLKEISKMDIPFHIETVRYYIYDLKYLGRYEDAFKLAMDANITETYYCHRYNSTILSIVTCNIGKITTSYEYTELDMKKNELVREAKDKGIIDGAVRNGSRSKSTLYESVLDVALKRNLRHSAGVYLKLAEYYMYAGEYKKAVEIFENVLKWKKLKPIDAEYALNELMAECYEKIGDKKSAEKHKKIMQEILSW